MSETKKKKKKCVRKRERFVDLYLDLTNRWISLCPDITCLQRSCRSQTE